MAKEIKKPAKPEEPDLLPAMGLFTILIPMLLSMAAFSKLGVVQINMPERAISMDSDTPPDPDQQALNLSVGITKDYLVIGARGGFQPNVYFKEMWTFRCKSDNQLITHAAEDVKKVVESGHGPKCKDGSEMDKDKYLFEIETIELWAIDKESEEDPGRVRWALYTNGGTPEEPVADSVYVNAADSIISLPGQGDMGMKAPALPKPTAGTMVATLGKGSRHKLDAKEAANVMVYPLSAYDVIASDLIRIHTLFIDLDDANNVIIFASNDVQFDKVIQVMARAKGEEQNALFTNISLAKLGG